MQKMRRLAALPCASMVIGTLYCRIVCAASVAAPCCLSPLWFDSSTIEDSTYVREKQGRKSLKTCYPHGRKARELAVGSTRSKTQPRNRLHLFATEATCVASVLKPRQDLLDLQPSSYLTAILWMTQWCRSPTISAAQ